MFGRKKDTEETPKSAEAFDELALPVKPSARPAAAAGPMRPPVLPPRTPRPSEPKRAEAKPSQGKTAPFDSLEQEMASLLGRPNKP